MARSNRQEYRKQREAFRENNNIREDDRKSVADFLDACDELVPQVSPPEDGEMKSPGTLRSYIEGLRRYAEVMDTPLLEATPEEFGKASKALLTGNSPIGPKDGYSKNTVATGQMFVRSFLRYHGDSAESDAEEIATYSRESTKVDPTDMLDREEIDAMRDSAEHPKDRALFDFLLFTGQRISATLSLRWKHIDLEEEIYKLNKDCDGLKGADESMTWRPLLGAVGSLRTWHNYHPDSNKPDAFVFTSRPDSHHYDKHSSIHKSTANRTLSIMADEADVDKPVNPHAMRHNFVTIAKKTYDMENDVIKRLIGHSPESTVMQTTYAHLEDEDYREKARRAFNIDEDKEVGEEQNLTPAACPTCGEGQSPGAKACSQCGTVFTPDAQTAQTKANDLSIEGIRQAEDDEEADAVEEFRDYLKNNPEEAVEILQEEL